MKTTFHVPNHLLVIAESITIFIISRIPEQWAHVYGFLSAPEHLLNSGEALRSTKWVFGSQIDQMIEPSGPQETADIFGTLFLGKKPVEVEFGKYFKGCDVMPLSKSKAVVSRLISLGYYGRINFQWRQLEDDSRQIPLKLSVHTHKDKRTIIELEWPHPEDGFEVGRTIGPILAACEALQLPEIQPATK